MYSGMAAAEAAYAAITAGRSGDVLESYDAELRSGPVGKDLKTVRNVAPLTARFGPLGGLVFGGFDMWFQSIFKFSLFGTVKHGKTDAQSTGKAGDHPIIDYPKPDGKLSFDRLTNVSFAMTNHEESQPSHLHLTDPALPISVNLPQYAEPAQRYCPAGVYEVVEEDGKDARFVVNFQNCCALQDMRYQGPKSEHHTGRPPKVGTGLTIPICNLSNLKIQLGLGQWAKIHMAPIVFAAQPS